MFPLLPLLLYCNLQPIYCTQACTEKTAKRTPAFGKNLPLKQPSKNSLSPSSALITFVKTRELEEDSGSVPNIDWWRRGAVDSRSYGSTFPSGRCASRALWRHELVLRLTLPRNLLGEGVERQVAPACASCDRSQPNRRIRNGIN